MEDGEWTLVFATSKNFAMVLRNVITSNVLSMGIDVPNVSHVINFDMPMTVQQSSDAESKFSTYLQRVRRAGRFVGRWLSTSSRPTKRTNRGYRKNTGICAKGVAIRVSSK